MRIPFVFRVLGVVGEDLPRPVRQNAGKKCKQQALPDVGRAKHFYIITPTG